MRRVWTVMVGMLAACSVFPDHLPGTTPTGSDGSVNDAGNGDEAGPLPACPGACPEATRLFEESGAHRGLAIVGGLPFWSTSGGGLFTMKFCTDASCATIKTIPESETDSIRNYTGYFTTEGPRALFSNMQSPGYVCAVDVTNPSDRQCEYSGRAPYRLAGGVGEFYATDTNDLPKGGQAEEGVIRRVTFAKDLPETAEAGVSFFARTATLGISADRANASWFEWTDFPTNEHFNVTICPNSLKGCAHSDALAGTPLQVLVGSAAVFFSYTRSGSTYLASVPPNGGAVTDISSGLGIEAIASDGSQLYWAEQANPTFVKRCALAGKCTPETIGTIASPPSFMTAWSTNASLVFLANDGLYALALP